MYTHLREKVCYHIQGSHPIPYHREYPLMPQYVCVTSIPDNVNEIWNEVEVTASLFQYPSSSKLKRGNTISFRMPTRQFLQDKNRKVVTSVHEDD